MNTEIMLKLTKRGEPSWPILFQVAQRVENTEQVRPYIEGMAEIMFHARGVGLSAPQIGVGLRFFIYGLRPGRLTTVINPSIIEAKDYRRATEGCLSFPGQFAQVERAQKIIARYMDLNGDTVERRFAGLNAILFQHELDHLNGITIVPSP